MSFSSTTIRHKHQRQNHGQYSKLALSYAYGNCYDRPRLKADGIYQTTFRIHQLTVLEWSPKWTILSNEEVGDYY